MTSRIPVRMKRRAAVAFAAATLGLVSIATASAQGGALGPANPGLLNNAPVLQVAPTNSQVVSNQGGGLFFLDAHDRDQYNLGYNVVVDPLAGHAATEAWVLTEVSSGIYTIMQQSSGQYLDAHEIASENYQVVTRDRQTFGNGDNGQYWRLIGYGGGFYQIQQVSSGRYLDLDGTLAVTRPLDNNNNQTWRIGDAP